MQITKHSNGLLSIYFTAGYPTLDSTVTTAKALEEAGVDFLEIGFTAGYPTLDSTVTIAKALKMPAWTFWKLAFHIPTQSPMAQRYSTVRRSHCKMG